MLKLYTTHDTKHSTTYLVLMSQKPIQPDPSPASLIPMPHYDIQKAAIAGGLEVKWNNDLWGCRPAAMPRKKQGNQIIDLGDIPMDQTPTPNTAGILKAAADMSIVGQKVTGIQNASSKAALVPFLLAQFQQEPIFTKDAQKFVDLKNQGLLLRGQGLSQNVSSDIPTSRNANTANTQAVQLYSPKQIPAVNFPDFKKLPSEVKIMIWDSALPTFVEVVVNEDTKQFSAPGPRDAILDLCHDFTNMFHMKPIHLSCENAEQSNLNVVYIRPDVDTIYIGCEAMIHLDVKAFCAHPDNQAIENLALSAVSCGNLRWCGTEYGRHLGTRSLVGDLVRGLTNLKKLYVVEGDRLHRESEVDHWSKGKLRRYEITLDDVPVTTHLSRYDHRGKHYYWPPAKPWVQPLAIKVIRMYEEEVEREKSGEYEMVFTDSWSKPEMIPKFLSRTLLCWDRQPPREKSAAKMQFLPRPLPATQFFRNPIRLSSSHDFELARLSPDPIASTDSPNKTPSFGNRTSFLD